MYKSQLDYEIRLGSFDRAMRREALKKLHMMLESGTVSVVPELPIVNLHCHTFFSFNAYGYSPSAFAWEAKKRGLYAAGIIDFDVLDGVEEFHESCNLLGLRSLAGIESRVITPEWKDREINSPGEPGICYFMGSGFTRGTQEMRSSHKTLQKMFSLAHERNGVMLGKINSYLGDLSVGYEEEVIPLAPSGNPTERHMLIALEEKSKKLFPDKEKRARFWSNALGLKRDEVLNIIERPVELQMKIREKLMKYGGPGYTPPDEGSFPQIDEMISMVRDLGAVPTLGWLDGTSRGENDPAVYLDYMVEKGAACLNIVPDRNWNIEDEEERHVKVKKFHEIVHEAVKRKLPVIVGTEMNKYGHPFVDDFNSDAMRTVKEEFLKGAKIMVGHSLLMKFLGLGLLSEEVVERFKGNMEKRNSLFESIGYLQPAAGRDGQAEMKRRVIEIWEKDI